MVLMERKKREMREWGFTTQMQLLTYCRTWFSKYWGGNLSRSINV